jgi:hypothetical protein
MNVLFEFFNLFTGVFNVSVQLLQNESCYLIAIFSYIRLKKNDTTIVILLIANTSFATANTYLYHNHIFSFLLSYYEYKTHA